MDRNDHATAGAAMTRRGFLSASASAAGALMLAFHLPATMRSAQAAPGKTFAPNAYVRIGDDDSVTVVVALVEMGQGTFTSIPMLIAEELEVGLDQVRVEQAPANEKIYGHPLYGLQVTGGSASVQAAWAKLRQAGATARVMLTAAAAQAWSAPVAECRAERGQVTHLPSGRSLRYGQLAGAAALLPVPAEVALKDPSRFRLVGTAAPRVDVAAKVDGSAQFGIDVMLPGMKVAAIAVCPVIGGTLAGVDDKPALQVAGVRCVLRSANAVAVVADHYGAARKGLQALVIRWNEGKSANFSSKVWKDQLSAALKSKGVPRHSEGDVRRAAAGAARRHTAVYESLPQAHMTMEPINCTFHVRRDGCDVWLGTQAPARAQGLVAAVTGLPADKVVIHNYLVGGGFGRKLDADYVETAAHLARQVDFPLKVIFSREEDIQHDAYRPYFLDELVAALDKDGMPVAFTHRVAGSAVIARYAPAWLNNGQDTDVVHTAETPYAIPNKLVEYMRHEPPAGLLTGNWRGVGPTHHAFPNECFIDELALMAKQDPLRYRERLLAKHPRALAVLRLAAQKAGWGAPVAPRSGRGIALVDGWDSYAVLITDVTLADDGTVKITRMVGALDCGIAINPDGVAAQMESGIAYGLSAALYGNLTFARGRVVQSNFHDLQPLRFHEMPALELHTIKSAEKPGGMGEIGTAVAIPSLMNAISAAAGKRLRSYPAPAAQLKA